MVVLSASMSRTVDCPACRTAVGRLEKTLAGNGGGAGPGDCASKYASDATFCGLPFSFTVKSLAESPVTGRPCLSRTVTLTTTRRVDAFRTKSSVALGLGLEGSTLGLWP